MELRQTPEGRRIDVGRALDRPREPVWELLCDTHSWSDWSPSIRSVDCRDRYVQEGTVGRLATTVGPRLRFEVTSCANYRWTWAVAGIAATGHRVDRLGSDRCRVVIEVPVLAAGYVPVCRRALARFEELARAEIDEKSGS